MQSCIITAMTMTLAMKGQKLLTPTGIPTKIIRLPKTLTASGCAWGISIDCAHIGQAKLILESAAFPYGKFTYADGTPILFESAPAAPVTPVTGTPRTHISRKGGEGR